MTRDQAEQIGMKVAHHAVHSFFEFCIADFEERHLGGVKRLRELQKQYTNEELADEVLRSKGRKNANDNVLRPCMERALTMALANPIDTNTGRIRTWIKETIGFGSMVVIAVGLGLAISAFIPHGN